MREDPREVSALLWCGITLLNQPAMKRGAHGPCWPTFWEIEQINVISSISLFAYAVLKPWSPLSLWSHTCRSMGQALRPGCLVFIGTLQGHCYMYFHWERKTQAPSGSAQGFLASRQTPHAEWLCLMGRENEICNVVMSLVTAVPSELWSHS